MAGISRSATKPAAGPARGDRALRIADCGLRIGSRIDPESAIRNPQSAIQGGSEMPAVPHRLAPDEPENDGREGRMGFLEHLDELRTRIIRSCIAIGVGMLAAFAFVDRLANIVLTPIVGTLPPGSSLVFIRPGEAFSFYLNVAFIGGMLLAAPFVMYQVWGFIAPGLYANEKKFLIPFVVLTSAGSLSGALFSQYLLFPGLMKFYGAFNSPRMRFMPGVEETVELYMKMMIGMIVVFQIPTVVFFLAKMRLLTARFLWRHFKYAILIIFIVAAVLTPDGSPWNQTVVAAPMIGLYLLSIGLAWIVAPKRGQETSNGSDSTRLRLAFAATVLDQAARTHRTRSDEGREDFRRYWESSVDIPGPAMDALGGDARANAIYLVVGVVERDGGTLYCSVVFFAPDGTYLGKHRKIMPTASERLIWGFGDGSTMPVFETPMAKIGAVLCWENYLPLLRAAMYAKR